MNFDYVVLPALLGVLAVLIVAFCVRRLRAVSTKQYSRLRRLSERTALSLACLLVISVAACSLFNATVVRLFWRLHPPAGQMVMVGQYKMHINCLGNGSPTLVLETGLGDDALIWKGVQSTLAHTTRVCAYDRAGFGWSDSRPERRDADHIAAELHELLSEADIHGPIVLMGHSIGGLYIRDYATLYPAQVKGLIFVDSSTPLQDKNPAIAAGGSDPPAWLLHAAMVAGVQRVIGMCSGGKHDAGYEARKERGEHFCGVHYDSISSEASNFDTSSQEALRSSNYGAIPVLVITHDPAKMLQAHPSAQDKAMQTAWSDMQEKLKSLSTHSRQIIAIGSTHYVMNDRPDLLLREVPIFIRNLQGRGQNEPPNGSTIRE